MFADSGATFSMAACVEIVMGDGSPRGAEGARPRTVTFTLDRRGDYGSGRPLNADANDPGVVFFESRSGQVLVQAGRPRGRNRR